MKKTTVYLNDEEFKLLKKKAFLSNQSIAELIRKGVRLICTPSSPKEMEILAALENIRSKFENLPERDIEELVTEAKRAGRRASKSRH
ncbi:MAG: hypothetical protein HY391_06620 [Deltaproteobacteria bacterium]|nr:hypothetical protein [Deltaproteobacteria bacterium]